MEEKEREIEKLSGNQNGSMAEKAFESILSGKSTINEVRASFNLEPIEGGDALYQSNREYKPVLYFCDYRKNKGCKKDSCGFKGIPHCFFTSKSEYRATGILRLFLKIVTWKTRKAFENVIDYK